MRPHPIVFSAGTRQTASAAPSGSLEPGIRPERIVAGKPQQDRNAA